MTDTADYATQVHISASPERVFQILTTPDEFTAWWAPASGSATEGGQLRITFEGFEDPVVLRVKQAARPSAVSWEVESCAIFPEWVGTAPTFTLSESGAGGCDVQFRHEGVSPQLECYEMCRAGWDQYLPSLRDYIETGTGNPFSQGRPEMEAPTQPITLAVTVDAGPDRVFDILSTSEGQRAFWTADCDITGAHARFGFPGASADVQADVALEPNRLVRMRVTAGPRTSFLENSTFEWALNGTERDTRTEVVFRHYGFADYVRGGEWHGERSPEFDFGEMAETWALLLDRLRSYISTGTPNPYFPASAGQPQPLDRDID